MDDKKPDFVLPGGHEIYFDLDAFTVSEWRNMLDASREPEDEDLVFAKACGLEVAEIKALPFATWRRLAKAFYKRAAEPLSDPN